jgi:hypothetical protein
MKTVDLGHLFRFWSDKVFAGQHAGTVKTMSAWLNLRQVD